MNHTSTKPRLDGLGYYPCRGCYAQWKTIPGYRLALFVERALDLPVLWRVARLAQYWRIGKLTKLQHQHHSFEAEAVRRMARDLEVKAQAKAAKRMAKLQANVRVYIQASA